MDEIWATRYCSGYEIPQSKLPQYYEIIGITFTYRNSLMVSTRRAMQGWLTTRATARRRWRQRRRRSPSATAGVEVLISCVQVDMVAITRLVSCLSYNLLSWFFTRVLSDQRTVHSRAPENHVFLKMFSAIINWSFGIQKLIKRSATQLWHLWCK